MFNLRLTVSLVEISLQNTILAFTILKKLTFPKGRGYSYQSGGCDGFVLARNIAGDDEKVAMVYIFIKILNGLSTFRHTCNKRTANIIESHACFQIV